MSEAEVKVGQCSLEHYSYNWQSEAYNKKRKAHVLDLDNADEEDGPCRKRQCCIEDSDAFSFLQAFPQISALGVLGFLILPCISADFYVGSVWEKWVDRGEIGVRWFLIHPSTYE